jgi:hypothetical protein
MAAKAADHLGHRLQLGRAQARHQEVVQSLLGRGVERELVVVRSDLERQGVVVGPGQIQLAGLVDVGGVDLLQPHLGVGSPEAVEAGVGDVEVVRDGRLVAVLAEVDGHAGVGALEHDRRGHRLVVVGLRIADQAGHLQAVGQLVRAGQGVLLEDVLELVVLGVGAHVDAVEAGVVDVVDRLAEIDSGRVAGPGLAQDQFAHGRLRLAVLGDRAREREAFQPVLLALDVVVRIESVEAQRGALGGLPLQGQGGAGALLVVMEAAVARQAREEHGRAVGLVVDRVVGGRAGHAGRAVEASVPLAALVAGFCGARPTGVQKPPSTVAGFQPPEPHWSSMNLRLL